MGEVTQTEQLGLEKSEKKIHGDLDMKRGGGGGRYILQWMHGAW